MSRRKLAPKPLTTHDRQSIVKACDHIGEALAHASNEGQLDDYEGLVSALYALWSVRWEHYIAAGDSEASQ